MVVNNEEPLEIILLTYFEIESTVMGFHVYWNSWEPVIREVLKMCMEPQNEVDEYAVAVDNVDNESNVIGNLPKGGVEIMRKQYFTFWKLIPCICHVKITGKAVNVKDKGMRIPFLLQFTGNCKMNILQELICKL